MGNSPSVAEPREQHRLSKPRTFDGASSTSLLSSPLKMQLHGSGSKSTIHVGCDEKRTAIEEEEDPDESGDDSLGELASSVRDRLSCLSSSGSMASHTPNARVPPTKVDNAMDASQSSLVSEASHVDIGAALAILQEIKKNASPEDLMALREALSPTEPVEQVVEVPQRITEDSVRLPTLSLIRRRSLATPGLATRGKSHERLRKSRTLTEDRLRPPWSHVWRMDMFRSSPHTQPGAIESIERGRESPGPRAQTPEDMDYSQLGSLKLGSLVVTNGAASPTPSAMSRILPAPEPVPEANEEIDYFTASRGHEGAESLLRNCVAHQEEHGEHSGQVAEAKDGEIDRADESETLTIVRSGSSLGRELHQGDGDDDTSCYELPSRAPSQLVLDRSAPSIAADYMLELPTSPYTPQDASETIVSTVETVAAYGTEEDIENQLSEEARAFREEAFRILNGTNFSQEFMSSRQMNLSGTNQPAERAAELERPLQAKADSGYSSAASLRASKSSVSSESPTGTVSKGASNADYAKKSQCEEGAEVLYTLEEILTTSINGSSATPSSLPASNPKPARLSILRGKSWKKPSRPNMLKRSSSEVLPSPKSSQDSDPKSPLKAKRLQKLRPRSHQTLTVQTTSPISEGSIPSVPSEVVAAFSQRLTMSPGMEHLTRTFASVAHTEAAEEPEDGVDYDISIHFPSSNRSSVISLESNESAPGPPKHRYVASTSNLRNEIITPLDHEGTPYMSDFGAVTQSLRGSPYDIAMSALTVRVPSAPTHFDQSTVTSPALRTVAELDAGTDLEFAGMQNPQSNDLPARVEYQPYRYPELEAKEIQRPALSSLHTSYECRTEPTQTPGSSHPSNSSESGIARRQSPVTNFSRPHSIKSPSSASGDKQSPAQEFRTSVHSSNPSRKSSLNYESPVATPAPSNEETQQPDWEAHALMWRARRQSIGERLQSQVASPEPPSIVVSRYVTPTLPPSAIAALPPHISALPVDRLPQGRRQTQPRTRSFSPPPRSPQRRSAVPPLFKHPSSITSVAESPIVDRYNGGLGYGFERGLGVGGSAGTRDLRSAASRKSLVVSHQFGVDLSDVPVILRRV